MGPGLMWAHKLSYHGLQYFHGGKKIHNQLGKKVYQDADVYQWTMAQPEKTGAVINSMGSHINNCLQLPAALPVGLQLQSQHSIQTRTEYTRKWTHLEA